MGWFGHPIFPLGVFGPNHPPGAKLKKKKKKSNLNGSLGVAEPPPEAPGGGSATPHAKHEFDFIFYFYSLALGGSRTTPWGLGGWFGHPLCKTRFFFW
jgi:hypothetical protein